jgi:hypothetical protein
MLFSKLIGLADANAHNVKAINAIKNFILSFAYYIIWI